MSGERAAVIVRLSSFHSSQQFVPSAPVARVETPMDWYVKAFIRASLLWFTGGIALGLAMAVHPAWVVYRPAHAHMNVVGFITMMVFGVGYQLLPRLFGHKIQSRALAIAHWWLANVGLALMVLGFVLSLTLESRAPRLHQPEDRSSRSARLLSSTTSGAPSTPPTRVTGRARPHHPLGR